MQASFAFPPERCDDLVVGGGSAGAVVASRLSEDPRRRVLLLEAGPGEPGPSMRRAMHNANQAAIVPGLNWKIAAGIRGGPQAVSRRAGTFDYEAGKVLGGSSAINAVQALRGAPADFDEWAIDCGPEWGWEAVLPYFRALEDDPAGAADLHGAGGPMPIRRERLEDLTPLQAGLMASCIAAGFPVTQDHNDPRTSGVGILPKNVIDGVRMSTAMCYLAPASSRGNLSIVTGAHVDRLLWQGQAVLGVAADVGGVRREFHADRVILCAGAMNTPAVLMRSGIGTPTVLESLGISVNLPLQGVGENLMDHPVVGIWGIPKPGLCVLGEPSRQVLLRCSSGAGGRADDMHLCMMAGLDIAQMFPARASTAGLSTIAGLTACFNRSASRGAVRISSADPKAKLDVALNCLGEPGDVAPLMEGVRLAWRLLQHPSLLGKFECVLAWTEAMVRSDVALERAVASFVRPSAHVCGSAKMGASPATGAVVDPQGRVHGIGNLWVADASIMPRIPSAPTHLTTLMIAEKIAAGLKSSRQ